MTQRARVEWWFSAACAIPWLAALGPYLEACAFRLSLSRWPRPMLDDPGHVLASPLLLVLDALFLLSFLAIPLPMFLALWNYRKILADWRYSIRIAVMAVGLIAICCLNHYDPGRVWDWFL